MNYRYSYSGTDVRCWVTRSEWATGVPRSEYWQVDPNGMSERAVQQPPVTPIELTALHTVSISIHEPRGVARSLGYRNVKGFARSVRTIAGSLIMTVIEDHPLRDLMLRDYQWAKYHRESKGFDYRMWSEDLDLMGVGSSRWDSDLSVRIPSMLAPFDIQSRYVSEASRRGEQSIVGNSDYTAISTTSPITYAGWILRGVELVGEGTTTSVNDMITEVIYQFVARDYRELTSTNAMLDPTETQKLYNAIAVDSPEESLDAALREALYGEHMRRIEGDDFIPVREGEPDELTQSFSQMSHPGFGPAL